MSELISIIKQCSKCLKFKLLHHFRKNKRYRGGYVRICKECEKEYRSTEEYKKRAKASYYKHHDKRIQEKRETYENNKEEIKKNNRNYSKDILKYDSDLCRNLMRYEEVFQDKKNIELAMVRCAYCGKLTHITNDQAIKKIKAINGTGKGGANFYCSEACKKSCPTYRQVKHIRGKKPATTREVQPELRKMVLERDNWTCQKCGKSKDDFPELELHCHHMFPINEDPICSADMDNCETLCKECHVWKHQNIPGCSYPELKC